MVLRWRVVRRRGSGEMGGFVRRRGSGEMEGCEEERWW